jgi:hypothetical protein
LISSGVSKGAERALRNFSVFVYTYMERSRDPEEFLLDLKRMSFDFRILWLELPASEEIGRWEGKHLFVVRLTRAMIRLGVSSEIPLAWSQLSMVGRALPLPSGEIISSSLRKHREDMTSLFHTPPEVLEEISQFCCDFSKRNLRGFVEEPPFQLLSLSTTACLEKTRREGGQLAWAREALYEDDPSWSEPDRPAGVLLQEFSDLISDGKVVAKALSCVRDPQFSLRSHVGVVEERGLKARIVTKSQASVLVLGHLARQRLLRGLKEAPECRGALMDSPCSDLINRIRGCSGDVISSDLRAASDLIPRDVANAMVEGLSLSGKFSPAEVLGLRLCTQDHGLTYEGSDEVIPQVRGILMGLPTTWVLLSLLHLYWWRDAIRANLRYRSGLIGRAVICGDDLLAVAPPSVIDRYERNILRCGGELSPGKHSRTSYRGVFLEMLFEFPSAGLRPMVVKTTDSWHIGSRKQAKLHVERVVELRPIQVDPVRKGVIPLKGFFDSGPAHPTKKLVHSLPDWVVAGEVSESLRLEGHKPYQINTMVRVAFPKAVHLLRMHRIPPYLPRFLGGGGLVHPRGDDVKVNRLASRGFRRALASLLTDDSPGRDPKVLGRVWTMVLKRYTSWASQALDELLSTVKHHKGDLPPVSGGPWFDCGIDFDEVCISRVSQRLQLVMGLEELPVRLGSVAPSLSSRIKTLGERWKSAEPWSKSLAQTRERFGVIVKSSRVWLPPSEDPTRLGTFGVSFWKDSKPTCQLRRLVIDAMALPL